MLYLDILALVVGLCWGFICLPRIIYPIGSVLPRFREIRDLTKLETSHILYMILNAPAIWIMLLFCSFLAIEQFVPHYELFFLSGLVIALLMVLLDFRSGRKNLERKFIISLEEELLAPTRKQGSMFPEYSILQMRLACWRTHDMEVAPYRNLHYVCAVCYRQRMISKAKVCFHGNRKRYILECDLCHMPSIIRIGGGFFSEYKIITEACLPGHYVGQRPEGSAMPSPLSLDGEHPKSDDTEHLGRREGGVL